MVHRFMSILQCPGGINKELEPLGNYFLVVCVLLTMIGDQRLTPIAHVCLKMLSERMNTLLGPTTSQESLFQEYGYSNLKINTDLQ